MYVKFCADLIEQNDVRKEQSNEGRWALKNIGSRFFSFFNVKVGLEWKNHFKMQPRESDLSSKQHHFLDSCHGFVMKMYFLCKNQNAIIL